MKKFFVGLILSLMIGFGAFASPKTDAVELNQCISSLLNDTFAVLNNNSMGLEQKKQQLRNLLEASLDTNYMAKSVLTRQLNNSQGFNLDEFIHVYKQYLLYTYSEAVKDYNGQKVSIKEVKQLSEDSYQVDTVITDMTSQQINVSYIVSKRTGEFKIIDVVTENISLIKTQKDDFASTIQNGGITALMAYLKDKGKN